MDSVRGVLPFCVTVTAHRPADPQSPGKFVVETRHSVYMTKALSLDEAYGKSVRAARRWWPREDGWRDHEALVAAGDVFIDLDTSPPPEEPR